MLSNTWPDNDICSHLMSNNKCLLGRCIYTKYTCLLTSLMARPILGWNGAKTSTMSSLFWVVHSLGKGSTVCLLISLSQTPLFFRHHSLEAKLSASPHHRLSELLISQAVWREGVYRGLSLLLWPRRDTGTHLLNFHLPSFSCIFIRELWWVFFDSVLSWFVVGVKVMPAA